MVFSTIMYATRKEGISPEEFKNHYENNHIPLVKSLAGDSFPLLHKRRYIGRTKDTSSTNSSTAAEKSDGADERVTAALGLLSGSGGAPGSPLIIIGNPEDFNWDAVAELNFVDEEHFKKFMGVFTNPENAKVLAEDEEKFVDRSKLKAVMIGDICETRNEKV